MSSEPYWRSLLREAPAAPAIVSNQTSLSRSALLAGALRLGHALTQSGVTRLAYLGDNSAAWVTVDLAAAMAGITLIPLPAFFTSEQRRHALADAGVDGLLSDAGPSAQARRIEVAGQALMLQRIEPIRAAELPAGTSKITYTSGTTGAPKGVCLSEDLQRFVAEALAEATSSLAIRRHLCLLPLPVLLENVAGLYAGLCSGAEIRVPPLGALGWRGSSELDLERLSRTVLSTCPDSIIVLPQVLVSIVDFLERTESSWPSLKMVAVGGARTSPLVLERAERLGLPVYEGYGLSELGSVVSLNVPGASRGGSVGRALPGRTLRAGAGGEIEVAGPRFLGYTGGSAQPSRETRWFATGDIGRMDADGFLYVAGRRDHRLITGYGRNISPEWLECELLAQPGILQAVAVCPAWPLPGALLVAEPGADVGAAVDRCNRRLPDYARIGAWRQVPPMTPASGLLTSNGRPRRQRVEAAFRDDLEAMARTFAASPTPPSLSINGDARA